jgi:hypothetical protein
MLLFNIPGDATTASWRHQTSQTAKRKRPQRKPGANTMTKIAPFATVALTAAFVSGFVLVAPLAHATMYVATAEINDTATVPVSQKVRCITPLAQQKFCGL